MGTGDDVDDVMAFAMAEVEVMVAILSGKRPASILRPLTGGSVVARRLGSVFAVPAATPTPPCPSHCPSHWKHVTSCPVAVRWHTAWRRIGRQSTGWLSFAEVRGQP